MSAGAGHHAVLLSGRAVRPIQVRFVRKRPPFESEKIAARFSENEPVGTLLGIVIAGTIIEVDPCLDG